MNKPDQLVNKYCGAVEERVAACRDKKVAEYLKQAICAEVKRHSVDEAILNDIETYIDNLIATRFYNTRDRGEDMIRIEKNIPIEELIARFPFSVHVLMKKGIKCIVCGEPIWGTLEDAAKEKGWSDEEVDRMVSELNDLIDGIE